MTKGFIHKKSLGQHFLNSDYVPQKMCAAADIAPGDVVVEIGPGTGVLTQTLLDRGATVIAIEADSRAIAQLQTRFATALESAQLQLHHQDVRHFAVSQLGLPAHQYKVVANIPYYLSGLLFRTFLASDCQPSDLVFLVQKELAERIARDPKESLLSLSVKVFGTVEYVGTVKRGHFTPTPQVDSAIIAVRGISQEYFRSFNQADFFTALKAGFSSRRKQLAPNLKSLFPPSKTKKALQNMGLPETVRAEDLSLSDWYTLLTQLYSTA